MSPGEDLPRERRSLGTTRMEAFSDGVFSIAATLLVLDIALHPPGTALEQVLKAWPFYFAYVVSFLTIGAAWLNHTQLTDRLGRRHLWPWSENLAKQSQGPLEGLGSVHSSALLR